MYLEVSVGIPEVFMHVCVYCLCVSPSIKGQEIWTRDAMMKSLVEFSLSRTKQSLPLDSVGPDFILVNVSWKV